MQLTVEIPDFMARSLELEGPEQDRQVLEMLALEGYRAGKLSRGQVSDALGLGFHDTEEFLHRHGAMIPWTLEELEQGSENLRKFLAR